MQKLIISFSTENAAFGDSAEERAAEIARILVKIADRITDDPSYIENHSGIQDINGNKIGEAVYEG